MKLGRILTYTRSVSPGKGVFYFIDQDGAMKPLGIDQTRIRASKSSYAEAFSGDHFKMKNISKHALAASNPQLIEECYAPSDKIYCQFSLRIDPNSFAPDCSSEAETRKILEKLAETYNSLSGYREIAERISKNMLMGTWLWRNKRCRGVSIEVNTSEGGLPIYVEDALDLDWESEWEGEARKQLTLLTDFIEKGLTDKRINCYMDVKAEIEVGWGDEIYPSQEYVENEKNPEKKARIVPTKQLARAKLFDGSETVAFHSQKIGAALLFIDDWYSEEIVEPLRVNEFGSDRKNTTSRRHPIEGQDAYQLLRKAEKLIEQMETAKSIPSDVHFIMSVLVKGGLFNSSKPES